MTTPSASRFLPLNGLGRVQFVDFDGDAATIVPASFIADGQTCAAVYIDTSDNGVYVPLDAIDEFIAAIREVARVAAERANTAAETAR
ncbi:hypothetical protein F7Q99_20020 [Streptomyces kaniharaensis]|uniref:Uncharacterized protein n=1 Tax=Streptomyces kaniharaensis TaxID=212423 RepID=A0A6N7KVZ4_9ACTN|nr:hypothetical protein [Streptomyces kaniharaensis]MQS14488.1 hypothetical protein [Streptomyces kaniharaensis]